MKTTVSLLILVFAPGMYGQKTFHTDSGRVEIFYRTDKTIAAYNLWETSDYGHCVVLDPAGKQVFRGFFGYRWGGGSCRLSFHPDGSVKEVHKTFQPDGGIQRTDIRYGFDPSGKQVYKMDTGTDPYGRMNPPGIEHTAPGKEEKPLPPPNHCAEIVPHFVYVVNPGFRSLMVTVREKSTGAVDTFTVPRGDSVQVKLYYNPLKALPPDEVLEITVVEPVSARLVLQAVREEHRYYYLAE